MLTDTVSIKISCADPYVYIFLLSQPTLWSKVFKYQLELGHNTEAYNAMIENPDPSRRKDCLRQLLIMLCDRGDLQSLVDFPYTDLEVEVRDTTLDHAL